MTIYAGYGRFKWPETRMFPIMISTYSFRDEIDEARKFGTSYLCIGVPWEMIEPHRKQAQKNHSQTLERLAERGGLSATEALAVLSNKDWDWRPMNAGQAHHDLCKMVANWNKVREKAL